MTKRYLFIALLLLTCFAYGQRRLPRPSSHKWNNNCVRNKHYSLAVRMQRYPFDQARQVQFVSFDGKVDIFQKEFIFPKEGHNIDPQLIIDGAPPPPKDTVQYAELKEIKILSPAQIDTLTDILYNYGFPGRWHSTKTLECYDPRNAILFLDSKGQALAFTEICFQCRNTETSSDKISLGEMCEQKMDTIRKLFEKVGVKYGVVKEEETSLANNL